MIQVLPPSFEQQLTAYKSIIKERTILYSVAPQASNSQKPWMLKTKQVKDWRCTK